MKTNRPAEPSSSSNGILTRRPLLVFVLVLIVALGWLFRLAFHPDFMMFSNDGPYGLNSAGYNKAPEFFTGIWCDLNSIGVLNPNAPPGVSGALSWLLGPFYMGKFYALISLIVVGAGGWFFFRQCGLGAAASLLGGLATALIPDYFTDACWGTASHPLCYALNFFAMGLAMSRQNIAAWVRYPLAGMLVGVGVVEAYDIGAIFSVFTAAFVVFHAYATAEKPVKGVASGGMRVAVVGAFAVIIAISTLFTMIGTQIKGISGTKQDKETKEAKWEFATWGSFPMRDLPGMVVPGLLGYRMMGFDEGQPPEAVYWGTCGRDSAWENYFASGKQSAPPGGGMIRWGSGGGYVGILVFIGACWALLQSFRREKSVFTPLERKFVWFWAGAGLVAMLLSFGKFMPFYGLLYQLPYVSTIRIPAKFLHVANWTLLVLFAYGIYGALKQRADAAASAFDKRWLKGSWAVFAACVVGWLIYSSKKPWLVNHLQDVLFDAGHAEMIAAFSINQAGLFLAFFAVALGLFTLALRGAFNGSNALLGVGLLAAFLFVDLSRVGARWLAPTYNWKERYVRAADNELIRFLKDNTKDGRVVTLSAPTQSINWVFRKEWLEFIFQFQNIQSLDVIQMSRPREDLIAFERAVGFDGNPANLYKLARRWQLTNTRYIIGPVGLYSELNTRVDPAQRFQPRMIFELEHTAPAGPAMVRLVQPDQSRMQQQLALFEFTGTLPRAKLYSRWQVSTNDDATLALLGSREFDPESTVLVSDVIPSSTEVAATNSVAGSVTRESYDPRRIVMKAKAESPAVLLFNDRHDPTWKAYVDGKPATLLRCNYIMRGVQLDKGEHTVELRFEPEARGLGISVAASAVALLLIAFTAMKWKRNVED